MAESASLPIPQQAWELYQNALILEEQGSNEEAMREYIRALVMYPGLWQASFRLALIEQKMGQPAQALSHFLHFLQIAPPETAERSRGLCMVGQILLQKGHVEDALTALTQAIKASKPDYFAHFYLGELFYNRQMWAKALAHYQQFLDRHTQPQFLVWRIQIRHKERRILQLLGDTKGLENWRKNLNEASDGPLISLALSAPSLFQSTQQQKDWLEIWRKDLAALMKLPLEVENPLWELDNAQHFQLAQSTENICADMVAGNALLRKILPEVDQLPRFPDNEFRTPRLGLWCNFGSDVYRGFLPLLLQLFQDYQVLLLSASAVPEEILNHSEVQIMVFPKDLALQRKEILALELDLLIYCDLGPHDLNSILLANYRLAPVQAVLPGYPVTTGIPSIDYYLSSKLWEPENAQSAYCEKLVMLDGTPFGKPQLPEKLLDRGQFNLPLNATVYLAPVTGTFLHPDFDLILKGILESDPQALVLALGHSNQVLNQQLQHRWQSNLGSYSARMQLLPPLTQVQLLSFVKAADIVLDPFYFGLGAQAFSFLSLGTPIITWPGEFQRGRYALAAYRLLELDQGITDSPQAYLQKALEWGAQPPIRHAFKQEILAQTEKLNGYPDYLRDLRAFILEHIERTF
jgi:tetratricopeptide (TPR) repeat protein